MGFEALRENESIPFFKDNKIATPARVTSMQPTGGAPQPTLKKSVFTDTGVGKQTDQRDPDISAYGENSYNLS